MISHGLLSADLDFLWKSEQFAEAESVIAELWEAFYYPEHVRPINGKKLGPIINNRRQIIPLE
jgi:hypothetical protein